MWMLSKCSSSSEQVTIAQQLVIQLSSINHVKVVETPVHLGDKAGPTGATPLCFSYASQFAQVDPI